MKKKLQDSKALYWGLIITFTMIYVFIGFVSTLHSIEFFRLANKVWLAVMLGVAYETGQISVLFSILMTKGKNHFLPWLLMLLMTSLQITANVYASYKYMVLSGTSDWQMWKQSLLFWLDASDPEMYRVVISWITGALLPIVALGLTALVAQNIQLKDNEPEELEKTEEDLEKFEEGWSNLKKNHVTPPDVHPTSYLHPYEEINALTKQLEEEEQNLIEQPAEKDSWIIEAQDNIAKMRTPEQVKILETQKKAKGLLKGAKKVPKKKAPSQRETKKALAELKKPSKGEELLEKINSGEIIIPSPEIPSIETDTNQITDEKDKIPIDEGIKRDGVEVIDVKVIPKDKAVKLDKFGIPIQPGERLSFDKI